MVLNTCQFDANSEFISVKAREWLGILKKLPDGSLVIKRESTGEEGLVPASVFMDMSTESCDADGIQYYVSNMMHSSHILCNIVSP